MCAFTQTHQANKGQFPISSVLLLSSSLWSEYPINMEIAQSRNLHLVFAHSPQSHIQQQTSMRLCSGHSRLNCGSVKCQKYYDRVLLLDSVWWLLLLLEIVVVFVCIVGVKLSALWKTISPRFRIPSEVHSNTNLFVVCERVWWLLHTYRKKNTSKTQQRYESTMSAI